MADERKRLDAQHLASLHEGRLSAAERQDALADLARHPEDLALLADVAAIERDTAERPAHSRASRWNMGRSVLLAAAGIVLVAGVSTVHRASSRTPSLPPDLSFEFSQWRSHRGAAVAVDSVTLSWRLGTRLADIEALIDAADSASLRPIASEVAGLLASSPASIAAPYFQRIADSAGVGSRRLRALARDGRRATAVGVDERIVALAHDMETARIAAHSDPVVTEDIEPWIVDLAEVDPELASRIRVAAARGDAAALTRLIAAALDARGR